VHKQEKVLEIAVEAARNRTTLGEISDALEAADDTKHKLNLSGGVYSKEIKTTSLKKQKN
jgi:methylmalonyl-CoA mutase